MKKAKQAIPNQYLINERSRRGWSQQDVADRVGTTPVNVSRWERGATSPSPHFRQQLATLFGKSPEELGLSLQEASSSEDAQTVEPVDAQSDPLNDDEEAQDSTASVPTQETELVSSPIGSSKSIPQQESLALPSALAPVSAPVQQPLRHSLAARVVALTSLVLIFMTILGLFLLNGIHQPSPAKNAVIPQQTTTGNNTGADPTLATYGVTKGTIILDDPLSVNNTQIGWAVSTPTPPTGTGCYFTNGTYDVKQAITNYCLADNPSDAANFVYQIQMTTLEGQWAGIAFRVDDSQTFYYEFLIAPDGSYRFYRSNPAPHTPDTIVYQGTSSAIHKGYHQANWLAVKAIGPDISLYVNSQMIYHTRDSAYISGNLGVSIVVDKGQGETEITCRNATAWSV